MTPADLRSLAYAMRTNPTAYAASNDTLAAFCYGVLVGAGDDRVREAWRAAVAQVFYPDDHGSMDPEWSTHPTMRAPPRRIRSRWMQPQANVTKQ